MYMQRVFRFENANLRLLGVDECGDTFDLGIWYHAEVNPEDALDMAMLSAAKDAALTDAEETIVLNPECRVYGWDDRTAWKYYIMRGMDLPDDGEADYLG